MAEVAKKVEAALLVAKATIQLKKYGAVVRAACRKVRADDAMFLARTGKQAADFAALGDECKAAEAELADAVHALEPSDGTPG